MTPRISQPVRPMTQASARRTVDTVRFHGEQVNPYRFMPGADLFLLSSYHEAAPLVLEEAASLGLPILTVRTTSSREMVTDRACGWVCENSQRALNETLCRILEDREALGAYKEKQTQTSDNNKALAQFRNLTDI